jgi:hypothetical protein
LVWQIAKDGEDPFYNIEPVEVDRLKHDDKLLNCLICQFDEISMPEKFKILFIEMTRYAPQDRMSLSEVRKLTMLDDDDQYAEVKRAFENNATELTRDIADVKVCKLLLFVNPSLESLLFNLFLVHLVRFNTTIISLSRHQG